MTKPKGYDMSGSIIGNTLKISTWGESHGKGLGAVVDGFPAGMELCEEDVQYFLDRRKPGTSSITTPRKEDDLVQIMSGVFEGKTTGAPISLMILNTSQHSADYTDISDKYRPGHADYGFDAKYGFRDYRGGGRSSGRETAARVAAGAICSKLLGQMGISVHAYTKSIGPVSIDYDKFDLSQSLKGITGMPDSSAEEKAIEYLNKCREQSDSAGGTIECVIKGAPSGIGDPVFDKLDALFARALMSIGAVKAVEVGDGILVSNLNGSTDNDGFIKSDTDGIIKATSNHAGGILGGISDGNDIILRCSVKPTPSIFQTQQTVDSKGNNVSINIKGRHDPVVVPRAVVVVECMSSFVLLDAMLSNMSAKASNVISFYKKTSK